jgi:hypothetical protein
MLQILELSLKYLLCKKRGMGYAKVIHEKNKRKKRIEKKDKCLNE